jgi:hypothetical protein
MTNRDRALALLSDMARTIDRGAPATVPIFGEIGAETERDARRAIELAHRTGAQTLRLLVDSNGGDDVLAINIHRDLTQSRLPIAAHAYSRCHSAALRPFVAASWRSCGANASFVMHNQTVELSAILPRAVTAEQLQRAADRVRAGDDGYVNLLRNRVTAPWLIASAVRSGIKLNALAAEAIGLVHAIRTGASRT